MKRRDFLAASAVLSLLASPPALAVKKKATAKKPQAKQTPRSSDSHSTTNGASTNTHTEPHNVISLPEEPPARWRTVDIQTNIALKRVKGRARLWLASERGGRWVRRLGGSVFVRFGVALAGARQ